MSRLRETLAMIPLNDPTRKRSELLTFIMEMEVSTDEHLKIIEPLEKAPEEEKEKVAKRLLMKMSEESSEISAKVKELSELVN